MKKSNLKKFGLLVILGILLIGVIGIVNVVNAQETLANGGDSFATAVKIEPGKYQGGALEEYQELYYYFQGKAGQEIRIKAEFLPQGNFTVALYDEAEEELTGYEYGRIHQYSWLANADKSSYKYYLKIASNEWLVNSLALEISLTDYYDAGGQTDAGDTFNKAVEITAGEYTGYLAASYQGTDEIDIYKIAVTKGETLTAKATPSSDDTVLSLSFYDDERQFISEELAPNKGAVVSNSVEITRAGEIFAKVVAEEGGENLNIYSLEIGTEGVAAVKELGAVKEDKAAGEEPEIEGLLSEKGSAEKEVKTGIMAVVIGLIVLIIIIIVIVVLIRKRKRSNK